MKNLERIKKTINGHKSFLKERFEVKSIGIFGSYLRGEQSEKSDIDYGSKKFITRIKSYA